MITQDLLTEFQFEDSIQYNHLGTLLRNKIKPCHQRETVRDDLTRHKDKWHTVIEPSKRCKR